MPEVNMGNDNLAYQIPEYEDGYAQSVEERKPRIEHRVNRRSRSKVLPMVEIVTPAIVAVVLLAGVISNQIEVSKLTTEQSEMSAQLAQLQSNCADLEAQLASKTGITAVEDYAENQLGLTKLDKSQVEFVEIPAPTVSEVVKQEDEGFFSSVSSWFADLKEYFGIE